MILEVFLSPSAISNSFWWLFTRYSGSRLHVYSIHRRFRQIGLRWTLVFPIQSIIAQAYIGRIRYTYTLIYIILDVSYCRIRSYRKVLTFQTFYLTETSLDSGHSPLASSCMIGNEVVQLKRKRCMVVVVTVFCLLQLHRIFHHGVQ